jgi:hypothetical protein
MLVQKFLLNSRLTDDDDKAILTTNRNRLQREIPACKAVTGQRLSVGLIDDLVWRPCSGIERTIRFDTYPIEHIAAEAIRRND